MPPINASLQSHSTVLYGSRLEIGDDALQVQVVKEAEW